MVQLVTKIQSLVQQLLVSPLLPDQENPLRRLEEATNSLVTLVSASSALPSAVPAPYLATSVGQENGQERRVAADSSSLAEATAPPYPLNILLVEDNPFTQKLMKGLLTRHNHQVTLATHGQEALTLLKEAHAQTRAFDMVLMDIRMPVLDGLETTVAIRQWEAECWEEGSQADDRLRESANRRLPIIAVTALTGDEHRSRALQAGMDGFHGKPVQANQLFAEMGRLVPVLSGRSPAVEDGLSFSEPSQSGVDADMMQIELDMDVLLKTVENDWALLGEIVDLYRMDAPNQLQRIRSGIERNDAEQVREAAHSLKGASAAFGHQTPTYALAFQLEQAGRSRDLHRAEEMLEQLQRSITALEKALCAELSKNKKS